MSDNAISSTTQEFLDVYDITNNMTILKDGTVSMILRIGTMNFSLLAEQEQDAIIYTYGALLNSLNYPIQINIQSQTKDATKYLRLLDEQTQKASSPNKANLIKKYRNFVSQLIRERNVLEKKFFIVIPASPGEMGLIAPKNVLPGQTTFDIRSVEKTVLLEKAANILEPRRDHLISQCNRLGLFAEQLQTQEIIQNFYINYNPEAQEGQEITNSESYKTPLVRASFSRNPMQDVNNATPQATTPPAPAAAPVNQVSQAAPQTEAAPEMPVPGQVLSPDPNLVAEPATTQAPVAPTTDPTQAPTMPTTPSLETNTEMPMPNVPPAVETAVPTETAQPAEAPAADPMQNNPTINLTLDQNNMSAEKLPKTEEIQATPSTEPMNLTSNMEQTNPEPKIATETPAAPSMPQPIAPSSETAVTPETAPAAPQTESPATQDFDFSEEITPMQGSINANEQK